MCQGCLCRGNTFAYPGSVGPEVLELVEEPTIPNPGTGDVRIRVLAAGTGFTDSFIRRGRYPDLKGPLPFTPGYELVGVVDKAGSDVVSPREGQIVADVCVVGGYAQYAIRPARFLVPVPDGIDAAEAVCIPLAYLTAFQMLTRPSALIPRREDPHYRRVRYGRYGAARSLASFWPQGNRYVLSGELHRS